MTPLDPDHPAVRHVEVCVRDVEKPDLGQREVNLSELRELKRRGVGDLQSQAFREIERHIDIEDHIGETVAEIYIDVDGWAYAIRYHVEVPVKQRIRDLFLRGRSS